MKLSSPRRAVLSGALAATVLALALTASAQANVQLQGLNGRIAWDSQQAFPPDTSTIKGTQCFRGSSCSLEIYSMNPDGSDQVRLTNNLVFDGEPAWLPSDGANIAFESDTGCATKISCGGDNLWSMTSSGATPGQLTNDPGDQDHPTYSPDGSRIAYQQSGLLKEFSATRGGFVESRIMIVPAAGELGGGIPTPLLPGNDAAPGQTIEDFYPAWSPDGTKIAFTRFSITSVPDPPTDGVTPPPGETVILDERTWVAPASGTGPAVPIETYAPCSQHFTNNLAQVNSSIDAMVSSGSQRAARSVARGFIPNCIEDDKPAWSPDGSKLAVSRFTTGAPPVIVVPSTRGGASISDPGDIVVFNSSNGANEVDLSDVTEPANCNTSAPDAPACSEDEYPDWSPDSSKIVFDSDRDSTGAAPQCQVRGSLAQTCDNEIWVMNADGSGVTQLTNNDAQDRDPDWQRIPPPPPVQPATPVKPTVVVAGVRRACVSSAFHLRFRVSTAASTIKKVVVKLDGKTIKSTSKGSFTLSINSKKLKAGRHRVTITATNAAGQTTITHRSFSICKAAKPRRKAAPRFTG